MLGWSPFKKFPSEDIINENCTKIESELLKEDIQEVKYWGTSIVVLRTEKDVEKVINFYLVNKKIRYFKQTISKLFKWFKGIHKDEERHLIHSKRVYAIRPAEPDDIIWENIPMKDKSRSIISFIIYIICIVLLIPAFFLTEFVISYTPQESSTNLVDSIKIFGIQLIISVILFLIEVLIEVYILISTTFEKQMTNTDNELSIIYKMSLLKFLNNCLVPILGNNSRSKWFSKNGLVQQVIILVVMLFIWEIIRIIFNPEFLLKYALKDNRKV